MCDSHSIRKDSDLFTAPVPAPPEVRAEQLRQHLTVREARAFGIDPPYGDGDPSARPLRSLLSGVGAALSTVTLFTAFGVLSSLGLPDLGAAIAVAPVTGVTLA